MDGTVLVCGRHEDLEQLLESMLGPYLAEVEKAATLEDVIAHVRGGRGPLLAIVLPGPAELSEEISETLRALTPATHLLGMSHFTTPTEPLGQGEVETNELRLDASELAELLDYALRSTGRSARVEAPSNVVRDTVVNVVLTLTTLLESYTYLNGGNSSQIMEDGLRIGRELGLGQGLLDQVAIASLVHDLGMLRLKLSGSGEPLNLEEHCVRSANLTQAMRLPWNLKPIILAHHEHYDGHGYPRGLRGREIPIGARILNVVDTFYSLTSRRPDREPLSHQDALEELVSQAGRQFDPEVVEIYAAFAHQRRTSSSMKRRVALMEPDAMTRHALVLRFERSGYAVSQLEPERAVIDELRGTPPDGLVLGVGLEQQSGLELLHWLRSTAGLTRLPCIAMVHEEEGPSGRRGAFGLGADEVLMKPVKPREVVACLGAISRRRLRNGEGSILVSHSGKEGLRGQIEPHTLVELCQVLRNGRKTARLSVLSGGFEGSIDFVEGQLVNAEYGDLEGESAFLDLVLQESGSYSIRHGVSPRRRTLSGGLDRLLLEALISSREMEPLGEPVLG